MKDTQLYFQLGGHISDYTPDYSFRINLSCGLCQINAMCILTTLKHFITEFIVPLLLSEEQGIIISKFIVFERHKLRKDNTSWILEQKCFWTTKVFMGYIFMQVLQYYMYIITERVTKKFNVFQSIIINIRNSEMFFEL